jgi:signal recognition particle subunit SRP54
MGVTKARLQVIRVVRDELIELLGGVQTELQFSKQPPSLFLMVGLQGSGKTTSSAKLASWFAKNNHTPLLLSVDVYRPAAVEQLHVLCSGNQLGYFDAPDNQDLISRAEQGLRHARNGGYDVVLIDTAGRLHIDDEMKLELDRTLDQVGSLSFLARLGAANQIFEDWRKPRAVSLQLSASEQVL